MAIKKLIILMLLFSASFSFLTSQEVDSTESELETTDEELIDSAELLRRQMEQEIAEKNVIVQPLSWESAGEVLKYDVIIQKRSETAGANGKYTYTEIFRHVTDEQETEDCTIFLDPTLPAGYYRLIIQVYNVLGMLEEDYTSVEDFTILPAHLPEVKKVSYPLNSGDTIYLDDGDNDGIIRATGKNLHPMKESDEDISYMDYILSNDRRKIHAQSIINLKPDKSEVELQFDPKNMAVGVYDFSAVDASGLHSVPDKNSQITIKFKKLFDFDLSGGYMCPIVLFDDTIKTYMDTTLWPVSIVGKATFIAYKQIWGYLGLNLSIYGTRFFGRGSGDATYDVDGNFLATQLNFVYQKPFYFKNKTTGRSSHRLTLDVHAGAGLTMFNGMTLHFEHNIDSDPLNSINFSADAGVALQVYITKRLYVETGADFLVAYVPLDSPDKGKVDMFLGTVIPSVSVGWQF
ncbi:MAG: hypothetical protein J6W60_15255 [Treponema sp.]|nr:hypothetical protein [Treponema sp.]MBP5754197.1 hypothetical protein [Treponema sp.]